jgi:apolipoprotein N-acyltransferase
MHILLFNAIIAAAGTLFSNGKWVIPIAAWIAPLFLMKITRTLQLSHLFPVYLFYAGISLCMYTNVIPLQQAGYVLTVFFISGFFFIPYVIDRILYKKLSGLVSTLPFPLASTAIGYVFSKVSPFGSWALPAYSQFYNPAVIQLASLTGLWGIIFLMSWLAPVFFNLTATGTVGTNERKKTALLYGLTLAAILSFGGALLWFRTPSVPTVCIGGITAAQHDPASPKQYYLANTEKAASAGAKIVVWQEFAVRLKSENEEEAYLGQCIQTAREKRIFLAAAVGTLKPENNGNYENKIIFIDPDGTILGTYLKSRPVPGEPSVAGPGTIPVFKTPYGTIGFAICFDMDFPALIRQSGKNKIDILLVPANDWKAIDPLHTQMAAFRAVENGFSLVRITGNGRSAAFDNRGELLGQSDSYTTDNSILLTQVPVTGSRTVYGMAGDYFAFLCIGGLGVLLFFTVIKKKKLIIELSVFCTLTGGIFADTDIKKTGELTFFASSTLATQIDYREKYAFPNNLTLSVDGAVTPVTAEIAAQADWDAAPFLSISTGAGIGTGWNIPFVSMAKGLCKNIRKGAHDQTYTDDSLQGAVWYANTALILQFDYAAINPGEQNHLIGRLTTTFEYKAYTNARQDQAWLYKCDAGSNFNGWKYKSNLFIGYALPYTTTVTGAFIEVNQTYYNSEPGYRVDVWNLRYNKFGPIINGKLFDSFYFMVMAEFACVPNYTGETKKYAYFRDWIIDTDDPLRIQFSAIRISVMIRDK